jgi:hypothetical protein
MVTFTVKLYDGHAINAYSRFDTMAAAEEFVAACPKRWGLKAGRLATAEGDKGTAYLHVSLRADGVNGGRNEAGIKKIKGLLSRVGWVCENAAEVKAVLGM